jgi:Family of unknown function (DUF5677)
MRWRREQPSPFMGVPANRRHRVGIAEPLMREWGIYRLRIEAAEDLLDEGARMVDETGRTSVAGARFLLAAQAARCVHIFESVVALCRIGRGVPASMLDRALFEEALDAYWIAANPEDAPARADEHERALELGEHGLEQRFGSTSPMSNAEESELAQVMGTYKGFQRSWTLVPPKERLDLVKASWGDAATVGLDYTYGVIQNWNNVLLHSSPLGYRMAMGTERQINRAGPDKRWREALAHGCLAFYLVLRVIAKEWDLDKSTAERLFVYASCVTKQLTDAELRAVEDGKPCPCGSGRTSENCHQS